MSAKHSPEPWTHNRRHWMWDKNGSGCVYVGSTTEANMRRIVACVNACAGVPTGALESGAIGIALTAADGFVRAYTGPSALSESEQESLRQSTRERLRAALCACGRLP